MSCKLCGADVDLIGRSHVIPRWMYHLLPNDGRNFRIISGVGDEHEKRSQSGLYDSFVCSSCENRFQVWDDYAANVLRRTPDVASTGLDFGPYGFGKLTNFYLSILWRVHAYSLPIAAIDLKEAGTLLGQVLLSGDDSLLGGYEIIPTCSKHILSMVIIGPRWVEYDATRYWKLYMPRFQVLINISGNPGSPRFAPCLMKPGAPLRMLEDTFESGEVEIAAHAVRANMERKNARRR